ncbi:MAG: hypothetical protein M1831_004661 [Alyxoria varia]|nr:MAG: hypothetical protein M1831_004661 [Alyxoria varia]
MPKVRPSKRSQITIEDSSKLGTVIDDYKELHNQSQTLTNDKHRVKLGRFEQTLTISWRPVVFSFSFGNKRDKDGEDRLEPFKVRLEPLDIKTIYPYVIDSTTHLVASRRNTTKGLQALINAKHIVTEQYLSAVSTAATPPILAAEGELPTWSPLEQDFEANWPDPLEYIPSSGKEPNPRPSEYFAPNPDRINVFDGFTFVVGDQKQHGLVDPITNGSAKCLFHTVQMGETSVQDFVDYVKTAGGKKPSESFVPGTGKGVVFVRLNREGATADWAAGFCRDVDQELGQRSIEQNEFLDAILLNDASHLRKPLEEDEAEAFTGPPSTARASKEHEPPVDHTTSNNLTSMDSEQSSKPQSRFKSRQIVTSQFKGFDDFDTNAPPLQHRAQQSIAREEERPNHSESQNDSQPLFVRESRLSASPFENQEQTSLRKRDEPEDGHGDMINDGHFPGARAIKKQKLEEAETNAQNRHPPLRRLPAEAVEDPPNLHKGSKDKRAKKGKEIDVRSAAQSYVQELNSRGQTSDAQMVEMPHNPDGIAELRNLAIIEEIDVPASRKEFLAAQRRRQTGGDDGAQANRTDSPARNGWNDDWNGRRNFKRFRRKGQPVANRGHKVIVPLEEAKQKDFGIGDDYWLEGSGKTDQARHTQNGDGISQQSGRLPIERSNPIVIDDEQGGDRSSASRESLTSVLQDETHHSSQPREHGSLSRQHRKDFSARSQRSGDKRPAVATGDARDSQAQVRASKRPKNGPGALRKNLLGADRDQGNATSSDSDEDDDDGLKFKLSRKTRARAGRR